jgi:hypothetical protein
MPIRTDLWKVSAIPERKRRERGQGRILQTKDLPRPDSRLGGSYAAANSNR